MGNDFGKGEKNILEFVHIPKNGGTAVEKAALKGNILWGAEKKKFPFDGLSTWWHNPEQRHDGSYTFAIVRNPYDRIVSEYNYKVFNPFCKNDPDKLNQWIKNKFSAINHLPHIHDNHFVPQYKFIFDKNGNKKVDFVLNYENLKNEFNELMKMFNLPVFLTDEKINKKKCNLTSDDLNEESKMLIKQYYKKDFELFNYNF